MTSQEMTLIRQYGPCTPGFGRYLQHQTARDAYYNCRFGDFAWLLYHSKFDDINIAWELTHILSSHLNHPDIENKELAQSAMKYYDRASSTFLNDELEQRVRERVRESSGGEGAHVSFRRPYLAFASLTILGRYILYGMSTRMYDCAGLTHKIMPYITALLPYERLELYLLDQYKRNCGENSHES